MISADQTLAHLVGDYILQSDWMANEKARRAFAALAHALCYSLPFLFFRPSLAAWAFVVVTHFIVDRWRLARYVVWAKNWLAPVHIAEAEFGGWLNQHGDRHGRFWAIPVLRSMSIHQRPWTECKTTGYVDDRPIWLASWLLVIADNTLHLICNGIALRWL